MKGRIMAFQAKPDEPKSRPTLGELQDQASRALEEREGQDFGPLSHAERNRILFGL